MLGFLRRIGDSTVAEHAFSVMLAGLFAWLCFHFVKMIGHLTQIFN